MRVSKILKIYLKYLFMCGLLNDAVSSSAYTALNGRVFSEQLIGNDLERSSPSLIFMHCPGIYLEILRKPTKIPIRDSH
jgi:hypothetical protein